MLLTQALRKRQTLRKRIDAARANLQLVGAVVSSDNIPEKDGFKTAEELSRHIQSTYDTHTSLVKEYFLLVSKINEANNTNTIMINGEKVTLATAIEMRNNTDWQRDLVGTMQNQYTNIINRVEKSNAALELDIQKQVTASKVDGMTVEDMLVLEREVRARMEKRHLAKVHDPLNLPVLFPAQSEKLTELLDELDVKLNIANATVVLDINQD